MELNQGKDINRWFTLILLLLILVAGSYLRYVGLDWDAEQHLHPDERFLTMVESSLVPVSNIGEYFDTSISTLNPNNQGHGFYVYGTLPIFMVRYLAEWLGFTGYGSVYLIGRSLSALMDLMAVIVVFFIGTRLYNRKIGLLAAAFSSLAVLQIQQSHFFTVDTFATFFSVLGIYFAVEIVTAGEDRINLGSYLLFGAALGMAVASKINAAPIAFTLPLASLLHWTLLSEENKNNQAPKIILYLVLAAFTSLVVFRLCQPYAFEGPSLFNIGLNQQWVDGLRSLRAQTSGDVDFPPALQWARRPIWFSLKNMIIWGLGIPYGILAWTGFGWMGWKMVSRKSWNPDLVVWGWTGFYFIWQSMQWNSTMRYQLPIYPLLGIFAAWLIINIWDKLQVDQIKLLGREISSSLLKSVAIIAASFALIFTASWAYAFSRIYTEPHPRVAATHWIFQNISGPVNLEVNTEDGGGRQQLLTYSEGTLIQEGTPWQMGFEAKYGNSLVSIYLPRVINQNPSVNPLTLSVNVFDQAGSQLSHTDLEISFVGGQAEARIEFASPIEMTVGEGFQLQIAVNNPAGAISLQGAGIANESSWDDGLPLRMDGYDPYGGIYHGGLNFEMYWDDNPEKMDRFISTLDQADYILITSSRQWATTTRVPERYPLTTTYYRQLLGCPQNLTIEDCYNHALPGDFQGKLGFDFIETFQSNPHLGELDINDQPSEEAFTVYDHPKVFVFKKRDDFNLSVTANILNEVDLSKVIHITPKQAGNHPADLLLPPDRLAVQRQGGTWSDIFNPTGLINRNQFVTALIWYLAVFILGLLVYPLLRKILNGLNDLGYPLARTFGLLLFSYLVWLAGSEGIPVTRLSSFGVLFLIAIVGTISGYIQRDALIREWRENRKYYLIIEGLALGLFVAAILIRIGNPDLWHPWKGGEKPMDFSYFNAVLKSTTFPPYDPWFAGGYINYYYFGFVFVGMLVKLLGIMPSLAYNLILPTIFMMMGLGAFSITWNLVRGINKRDFREELSYLAGSTGVLGTLIFGNLGILRMVFQGVQRLASAGVNVVDGNIIQRIQWTLLGLVQLFETKSLLYRMDEWYWNPSRVIGGEHGGPITEFPFFTFLYGDLHAHFLALPLTVLALGWVISVVFSSQRSGNDHRNYVNLLVVPLFGALVVGSLLPTNTWDYYPYLALGGTGLLFTGLQTFRKDKSSWPGSIIRILVFLVFAKITFLPYTNWYGEGYTSISSWFGSHTPTNDFLVHWGLFLFVISSWMTYETIDWMDKTPVSALSKLKKYRELIIAAALILGVIVISLGTALENKISLGDFTILGAGVHIIWFVFPLMVWAGILLLRPDQSPGKSVVLFLVGTSLAITLMVELVYVEGDIGRMNTVFKFYLQAWTLFAVSAGAALCWMVDSLSDWKPSLRITWLVFFYILVSSAALYPLLGGVAKIRDRMSVDAPHTLDGMAFMTTAVYYDLDTPIELSQDYRAIRWMQDNVQGSPVIVEANQVEYHWATRYTVYTGLPGVVGWNWHQRQQRTLTPHDWVYSRVEDVNLFYDTPDLDNKRDFLERYQVSYIILGQLERAKYDPEGIAKFVNGEGKYWTVVYKDQETTIYETLLEYD